MSTPSTSTRSRSLRLPSILSRTPSRPSSSSHHSPSPAPTAPLSPSLTPSPPPSELPMQSDMPQAAPLPRLATQPLLQPLSISRPLSPLSSGLPSPTFSRPVSPFRPSAPSTTTSVPAHTPTPPLPVSVSLKTLNLPSPSPPSSGVEDILLPGDLIGEGLYLLGERIHAVPLGNHPSEEEGGEIAAVVEVRRKIGEGSNACVYLVREVLGEAGKVPPSISSSKSSSRRGRPSRSRADSDGMFGALEMDDEHHSSSSSSPSQPKRYGREFAIKVLSKRDLTPSQIGTQLQEAQIHQSLPYHPNIVTLHRTLDTQSWLLLILEHVPGEDLFYFLEQARDSDLPPDSAASGSKYGQGYAQGTDEGYGGEGRQGGHGRRAQHPTSSSSPHYVLQTQTSTSSSSSENTLHHQSGAELSFTSAHSAVPGTSAAVGSITSANSLAGASASLPPLGSGPLSHTPRTPSLLSSHSPSSLLSPQRLRLIARMFTQMCSAVSFCHQHGIAHRDIKPENFIVTEGASEDGERRVVVKLTDFGLASRERESRDVDCGSAPYMSFECANNVAPTYATQPADVWSLGVVLINMLYHQNPWPRATLEDEDGESGEAFALFRKQGAAFFVERFPGITQSMAQWLVDRVFCDQDQRVSAEEFGEWVMGLGGMVDEASFKLPRKGRSKARKDSVKKSKSKSRSSRRDAAVGGDLEGEERERGREQASPDSARDRDGGSPSSSREPSLMKRRKRGARSNKSKNSAANSAASLPLPSSAQQPTLDPEAAQLAQRVEALAREASMVSTSGRSGSRTPSVLSPGSVPGTDDLALPVPALPPLPMPLAAGVPLTSPVATSSTVRNRPSIEDEIWLRGRPPPAPGSVLPARAPVPPGAGSSWRAHHSPLNPNPHPYPSNAAYASSVSSFAPSTVSTYNTRLSNGSMRSLSTVATTMSDPTSVKSRWSGLRDPSVRSVGSADLASLNGSAKGKGKEREIPTSPLGKLNTGSAASLRSAGRPAPTNVKRIEGLPYELDELRVPFKSPTPAQRIVHNESKRSIPRNSRTSGSKLESIDERERERVAAAYRERDQIEKAVNMVFQRPGVDNAASAGSMNATGAVFQRRDASTSTTSLSSNPTGSPSTNGAAISPSASIATVYEERGTPGRAKQGQILTLGKILRGLGTRETKEAREAKEAGQARN